MRESHLRCTLWPGTLDPARFVRLSSGASIAMTPELADIDSAAISGAHHRFWCIVRKVERDCSVAAHDPDFLDRARVLT